MAWASMFQTPRDYHKTMRLSNHKSVAPRLTTRPKTAKILSATMKTEIKKLPKHQIEIKITIPAKRVGEEFEKVLDAAAKEIQIEGFRKGQAPKNLVREKIDTPKAYSEVINRLVSETYNTAIKEHLLKPIVNPQIELVQFEPEKKDKDFIFTATTAERPEVTLGDYKKELAKLKVKKPSEEIVGPDGKPLKTSTETQGPSLEKVLQAVLATSQVEIPDLLTEGEVNRMLSRLVDQTAKLGLTIEQYLQSQGKTAEQLRAEYQKQSQEMQKTELVLDELAKVEKIEVADKEIEEAIKANPDEKSRQEFEKQEGKWYIKSILRRNKTIQRLVELAK